MPTKLAMRCSCFLLNACGGETPLIGLSFGFLGVALRRPPYAVLAVRLRWGAGFVLGLFGVLAVGSVFVLGSSDPQIRLRLAPP